MAEPFKNLFNTVVIANMADHLVRAHRGFDSEGFTRAASAGLEALELKARSNHICDALALYLPTDFPRAARILVKSLHPNACLPLAELKLSDEGIRGWAIMPMAEYIARHGQEHLELSLQTLKAFTCRFTAEFAIRAFILRDQKKALAILKTYATDDNFHVRRLASEGARPRLPWGQQLPKLIANPAPLWPILNILKNDPHEYVRKSVANNLNDIAKDHPDEVNRFVAKWLPKADVSLQRLLKHGCRTLIKKGNTQTLGLFGFDSANIAIESALLNAKVIRLGESIQLSLSVRSTSAQPQAILLDYCVYFQKANGALKPKVFKWKSFQLPAGERVSLNKNHSFKPVTTRRLHPGEHVIAIQINGVELQRLNFHLKV